MSAGSRQALISGVTLLVVFAASWWFFAGVKRAVVAMQPIPPAVRFKTTLPKAAAHKFTRDETLQFLVAAQVAEDIKDPLQRCLKFPDPPGSHWNHAAVVAYCHYRNQPLITFAQAKQLIESGHAAKLDQLLAQALHAQQTEPDAVGRLDRIYQRDFRTGSFDVRNVLDAWKRQSPNSAFAYAASSLAYEEMAYKARGGKWTTETPDSNFESMHRLALEGDADAQRALAINPGVTPIYTAMIHLGGLDLGGAYASAAAERGLAVAPDDLDIYDQVMWLREPKWYGSLDAMTVVASEAHRHATSNPLLDILSQEEGWYRVDNCECSNAEQLEGYRVVADHLVGYGTLEDIGDDAKDANDSATAAIYYSEALRFNPDLTNDRINRVFALIYFRHGEWALAEGNKVVAAAPDNEYAHHARGVAYMNLGDFQHAQRDFAAAVRIDPKDAWGLWELGGTYVLERQWDKAWAVSSTLIDRHPKFAAGWLLRARVQIGQPRPGLDKTFAYLDAHFGSDANVALDVARLRSWAKWVAAHPQERVHPAKHIMHASTG
jgi:tetratricopeptide (TPR) repeat protein